LLKKLEQQKYLDPVSVSNKRTDATEIEITENKNVGLGFRVVNVIRKSRAPKVAVKTEMFLPGRSSYVFNVSRILGNDIPTSLLHSKEECLVDFEPYYEPNQKITEVVTNIMQSIREAKEKKQTQKQVVTVPVSDIMDESDDDDIFPDAGDYVPVGTLSDVKSTTGPKSYFKLKAAVVEDAVELPSEFLTKKQQELLQAKSLNNYNEKEVKDVKDAKEETVYYEECYKETDTEYSKFAYAEDPEEDDEEIQEAPTEEALEESLLEKRQSLESEDMPGPKRPKFSP